VSLAIEIASDVPEASRLRSVFSERAHELYRTAGVSLVDGPAATVLKIRHTERPVAALEGGDTLAKPGVLAETEVSLTAEGGASVFHDRFGIRVPNTDRRRDGSVLFAKSAEPYWERFYVPVASWATSSALRATWKSAGPLAGVGADLGRAVALGPDGSFREIDLSDPAKPRVVGQYTRTGLPGRFSGARRVGGRIAIFGEDGLELVVRQSNGYQRVAAFDRGIVGGVSAVEEYEGRILAAGTRGLVRLSPDGGAPERLIERPLRGIARVGNTLYVLDDQWLYGGPVADPRAEAFVHGRGRRPAARAAPAAGGQRHGRHRRRPRHRDLCARRHERRPTAGASAHVGDRPRVGCAHPGRLGLRARRTRTARARARLGTHPRLDRRRRAARAQRGRRTAAPRSAAIASTSST
jgi:hypothetical protein